MAEEPKKISFGFSKLSKKPPTLIKKPEPPRHVELIDCLESQTIKVKDAVEIEDKPLVIPIRDSTKNLLERVNEAKRLKSAGTKTIANDDRPDSELTLDELAARELLREAQKQVEDDKTDTKVFALPAVEEKFIAEGKEESTLKDYDDVPIGDFGMAMLRGMGWSESTGIGKNPRLADKNKPPELRPKGLGLGADRMAKEAKTAPKTDKDGKELLLIKGAYAKIIAGAHMGKYVEIQGLDDEAGRVIAKTALKGEILTLNEFLVVPVTKEEYSKFSKVLNIAKFNEYKEKEKKQESNGGDSPESNVRIKKEEPYDSTEDPEKNQPRNSKLKCDLKQEERSDSENSEISDKYRRKSKNNYKSDSDSDYSYKERSKNTTKDSYSKTSRSRRNSSEDGRTSSKSKSKERYSSSKSKVRDDRSGKLSDKRKKERERYRSRSVSRSSSEDRYISSKSRSRDRSHRSDDKYSNRHRSRSPSSDRSKKKKNKKKSKKHKKSRSSSSDSYSNRKDRYRK